jgi:hypothetical protein
MDADGQGGVLFLIQGSIKLIHFMAGQVNELWNVVGAAPPTFFLEPTPRKAITALQAPPIDRLHGRLGLPFGDTIPK